MKNNFKFFGLFVLVAALLASVAITGCGGSSSGGGSSDGVLTVEMPKSDTPTSSMRGALRGSGEGTGISVYAYLTLADGSKTNEPSEARYDKTKKVYTAKFNVKKSESEINYKVEFARVFEGKTNFKDASPIYKAYGKVKINEETPAPEPIAVDEKTTAVAKAAEKKQKADSDTTDKSIIEKIEKLAQWAEANKNNNDKSIKEVIDLVKEIAQEVLDIKYTSKKDADNAAEKKENKEKLDDKINTASNNLTDPNQPPQTEDDIKLENLLKGSNEQSKGTVATLISEKKGNKPQRTPNEENKLEARIWFNNDYTGVREDHENKDGEVDENFYYANYTWKVLGGKLRLQKKGEGKMDCDITIAEESQGANQTPETILTLSYVNEENEQQVDKYILTEGNDRCFHKALATGTLIIKLAPTSNKENNEVNTTIVVPNNHPPYHCGDVINIQPKQLAEGEQEYPVTFQLSSKELEGKNMSSSGTSGTVKVYNGTNETDGSILSDFQVVVDLIKANILTVRVYNCGLFLPAESTRYHFNPFEFKLTFQQPEGEASQDGDEGGKTDGGKTGGSGQGDKNDGSQGGKTNDGGK